MNDVITVSDDTFDEMVGLSDIPVVVDFWPNGAAPARWWPPFSTNCRRSQWQAEGGEAERRRQPSNRSAVPSDEHPDVAALQERRDASSDSGSEEQVTDHVGVRAPSLTEPVLARWPFALPSVAWHLLR